MTTVHFVSSTTEKLASRRMRVDRPKKLLESRGHIVTISDTADYTADVNVFQKHNQGAYDMSMMDLLAGRTKLVFDICDDHFDNPKIGPHYVAMCKRANLVTANGPSIIKHIKEVTDVDALLCKDPITFPEYSFKYNTTSKPKLLWYGHLSNFGPMEQFAKDFNQKDEYNLTVITNSDLGGNWKFTQWLPGVVEQEVKHYDIVLIPLGHRPNEPETLKNKQYKNTNRAVDALMAGRFVVTDSQRVYGELERFIYIGRLQDGIKFYQECPDLVEKMVKDGQDYIKHVYNDIIIADQWELSLTGSISRDTTEG